VWWVFGGVGCSSFPLVQSEHCAPREQRSVKRTVRESKRENLKSVGESKSVLPLGTGPFPFPVPPLHLSPVLPFVSVSCPPSVPPPGSRFRVVLSTPLGRLKVPGVGV